MVLNSHLRRTMPFTKNNKFGLVDEQALDYGQRELYGF